MEVMSLFPFVMALLTVFGFGFTIGQSTAKEPDIDTMKNRIVAHRVRQKLDRAERAKLDEEIEAESDAQVARLG